MYIQRTRTHRHTLIIIATHTLHICFGFRACPNGRVHHDAAHSYVYLGVGRVSLPVRDGAGLLPIHILVHIDIHSSSLPHILCTFVLAFGLVPMAVCNCVSCTAVASAFWRISLHRLQDNATNDLHGKISKATFAIVMRMTGHIHAQDHNSRNHLHSVFKCTLVVWLTRKYAEEPFLSPCCLAYRTLKAARLKYKKHRIGAESWNRSSHNFELVLIRIMQGDNLSRDDSVMISLRIVFQCSHFSIDCHICYPDSPRLWTPLRGCVLSGCWAGSEFFQDPQDFLSSGCTLYKFWAVGTPGSPSPIS